MDEDSSFPTKVNREIVNLQRVLTPAGEQQLKALIEAHAHRTNSQKAAHILAHWTEFLPQFWQVVPPSEAEDSRSEFGDGRGEGAEFSAVKSEPDFTLSWRGLERMAYIEIDIRDRIEKLPSVGTASSGLTKLGWSHQPDVISTPRREPS